MLSSGSVASSRQPSLTGYQASSFLRTITSPCQCTLCETLWHDPAVQHLDMCEHELKQQGGGGEGQGGTNRTRNIPLPRATLMHRP